VASLDELENLLKEASRLLDKAAAEIRDIVLEPQKNVRRIGGDCFSLRDPKRDLQSATRPHSGVFQKEVAVI
jgi:hypothetical protein